jgi:hypothetical protein
MLIEDLENCSKDLGRDIMVLEQLRDNLDWNITEVLVEGGQIFLQRIEVRFETGCSLWNVVEKLLIDLLRCDLDCLIDDLSI